MDARGWNEVEWWPGSGVDRNYTNPDFMWPYKTIPIPRVPPVATQSSLL
jgi:hypothetical protein